MDIINLKPDFISAFELLHSREDLFRNILEEYATVRRTFIVRNFIDSLTKTGLWCTSLANFFMKIIKQVSQLPIHKGQSNIFRTSLWGFNTFVLVIKYVCRYVNEMLAWVHEAVSRESETLLALTGAFRLADENFAKQKNNLICNITETLCQPLRVFLPIKNQLICNCLLSFVSNNVSWRRVIVLFFIVFLHFYYIMQETSSKFILPY